MQATRNNERQRGGQWEKEYERTGWRFAYAPLFLFGTDFTIRLRSQRRSAALGRWVHYY